MTTLDHATPPPAADLAARRNGRAEHTTLAEGRTAGERVAAVLAELREHLDSDRATNIGFPSTFDFDYQELLPFFNNVLNNVGDPYTPSAFPANTKHLEREVIDIFATLLRAPREDRWGYVTTGGTEGNEYGLLLARTLLPDAMTYVSAAAHYSGAKLLAKLRMPAITMRAGRDGSLDLDDLREALRAHRDKPAIILATIGTTMTEAIDDVATIRHILAEIPIPRAFIHADAALSGLPLALLDPACRPAFDLAEGADSISVSGHKFCGSPFPAGIVLTRQSLRNRIGTAVDYIATHDTTLGGSRSGHAPLVLWYALRTHGIDGLRQRAEKARHLAAYAVNRLHQIGWPAWRHPHALTVVLDTPPAEIATKWRLASSDGQSHLICLPGINTDQIDALAEEIELVVPAPRPAAVRITTPRPPYPGHD